MNQQQLETLLQAEQHSERSGAERAAHHRNGGIGILASDAVNRRLLEGLSIQLDLEPEILDSRGLQGQGLLQFELIVADEEDAEYVRQLLQELGDREPATCPPSSPSVHVPAFLSRSRRNRSIYLMRASSHFLNSRRSSTWHAVRRTSGKFEQHLSLADAELRRVALLTSQSLRFYKQSSAPRPANPATS